MCECEQENHDLKELQEELDSETEAREKLDRYVDDLEEELSDARKEIKELRQRLDDIRDLTD